MPVPEKKAEDENLTVFNGPVIKDGPESWQIKDFLNQNKNIFDINNIVTIPQEEKRTGFGGQKETVTFDLLVLKDGTVLKANIITTKDPEDPDGGSGTSYSVDMSKIKNTEEAHKVLSKLLDVVMQTELRFHPANTELRISSSGPARWDAVSRQVDEEKCAQYASQFQAKGIKVYFNDKLMIPEAPDGDLENTSQEKKRQTKPWDVPRGAPDARPKRE